jgi:hypothetical protein
MEIVMNRITLIARTPATPNADWNHARFPSMRVAFLDSVTAVKFALGVAVSDAALDIERVIVDRAGSADDFLDLLAALPEEFNGDVLMIGDAGNAFLSAMGRGGERVLYALTPHDVRFYLETHKLVTGRIEKTHLRAIA